MESEQDKWDLCHIRPTWTRTQTWTRLGKSEGYLGTTTQVSVRQSVSDGVKWQRVIYLRDPRSRERDGPRNQHTTYRYTRDTTIVLREREGERGREGI